MAETTWKAWDVGFIFERVGGALDKTIISDPEKQALGPSGRCSRGVLAHSFSLLC